MLSASFRAATTAYSKVRSGRRWLTATTVRFTKLAIAPKGRPLRGTRMKIRLGFALLLDSKAESLRRREYTVCGLLGTGCAVASPTAALRCISAYPWRIRRRRYEHPRQVSGSKC